MTQITKVAVVAVHGVADQKPGQTARELAALLKDCLPGQSAFEADEVLIPVQSLSNIRDAQPGSPPARINRLPHSDFSRSRFAQPEQEERFDVEFSADMVRDHQVRGAESLYRTECLRAQAPGGAAPQIHVYEMYWADLSRLSAGAWRILSELYQLIFHLSSLGRHTVDAARARSAPTRLLAWLSRTCATSEYALVGPIAMGNLALLALLLLLAGALLTQKVIWPATAALLLVYNLALFYAAWRLWVSKPWAARLCAALVLACLAGATGALLAHAHRIVAGAGVVFLTGVPLIAAAAAYAAITLGRRNAGVLGWAGVCGALTLGIVLLQFGAANAWPWHLALPVVLSIVANAAVVLFLLVMLGWALLALAQLGFACGAALAHLRTGDAAQQDVRRAIRTAMLCMMISTSMFAVVTISLWALLVYVGLPSEIQTEPLKLWFDPIDNASSVTSSVKDFTGALLSASSAFFAPTLVALAALGFAMFVAFLPSLIAELSPRGGGNDSERMGAWLDEGLYRVGLAAGLTGVAYILVMMWQIAAPLHLPGQTILQRWTSASSDQWVKGVAWALAASATSLLALGPALSKSLGRWRVVLDVALDVDNYFREHPRTSNPRSRIYARYLALLAHLQQQGYDKIVIVAHSQGTVISADLLRLIHMRRLLPADAVPHAFALTLPTTLLITAGSPLAQLYRARFAHLYRWIDPGNAQWQTLAASFGLARWTNIYRSGDYVGRAFWRNARRYAAESTPVAVNDNRAEMCLGAGAHTHYFDDTAAALAQAVYREITR
jgi:hypothetical protein